VSAIGLACVYVLGLALITLEFFIPGMIAGAVGVLCVLFVVAASFVFYGGYAGLGLLAGTVVVGYGLSRFMFRQFGHDGVQRGDDGYRATVAEDEELLNQTGHVETPLRPVGMARLAGRLVPVLSRGELIERGARVRVIEIEGNRVVVAREDIGA